MKVSVTVQAIQLTKTPLSVLSASVWQQCRLVIGICQFFVTVSTFATFVHADMRMTISFHRFFAGHHRLLVSSSVRLTLRRKADIEDGFRGGSDLSKSLLRATQEHFRVVKDIVCAAVCAHVSPYSSHEKVSNA